MIAALVEVFTQPGTIKALLIGCGLAVWIGIWFKSEGTLS